MSLPLPSEASRIGVYIVRGISSVTPQCTGYCDLVFHHPLTAPSLSYVCH